jgi:hypothetical protein
MVKGRHAKRDPSQEDRTDATPPAMHAGTALRATARFGATTEVSHKPRPVIRPGEGALYEDVAIATGRTLLGQELPNGAAASDSVVRPTSESSIRCRAAS